MKHIAFFDLEVSARGKIMDIGAVKADGSEFHSSRISSFIEFISDCDCLCGHNIISHDFSYIREFLDKKEYTLIDTLYLSPILFPKKPYHRLVKDDKLMSDQLNNPLNDSIKARELFEDEVNAFSSLPEDNRRIYYELLGKDSHFSGFFSFIGFSTGIFTRIIRPVASIIKEAMKGKICENADIDRMVKESPVELAYALAVISTENRYSVTPSWVLNQYPQTDNIIHRLRNRNCHDSRCSYCSEKLDTRKALKKWFGYDNFRTFGNGEPLQEEAVNAAVDGESLLAIFPTGGGKSLTFQLPALIDGENSKTLTVVISPLQSLMKDQVENLEKKGIPEAVYINGLLSPVERANALERVRSGEASLLYIAPEQLRSRTMERILTGRTIARFVIDEAHCFSAWGQDFRIEYMYIGEFINRLQQNKGLTSPIPVSCFTATAKPKVISDIADYFRQRNGLDLKRFTTSATRTNLKYTVLYRESEKDKYATLRSLLEENRCPSVVYVSRTATAEKLAAKLTGDGFNARAFHGQMDKMVKVQNQDDFISNKVRTIVATSAFGMGVDKSDIGLVVHYDISDSLENYLQEAGRAGRDIHSSASCYVLYNDDDLNKHFILLNQTKLTFSEINQVWKAVKALTRNRPVVHISALEVARKAGWDEIRDVETKVKSALAALENAGYIRRGMNSPRVFATSIIPESFESAAGMIDSLRDMTDQEKNDSKRIIKSLISEKRRSMAGTAEAESRIDYLSDMLGIETSRVIKSVEAMRQGGILDKTNDMTAYMRRRLVGEIDYYSRLESFLLGTLDDTEQIIDLKILNESAIESGIKKSKTKDIRTILFFWTIQDYIRKGLRTESADRLRISQCQNAETLKERQAHRICICRFILGEMGNMEDMSPEKDYLTCNFSMAAMLEKYNLQTGLYGKKAGCADMQEALLFLSKTGIISIEGGFMVIYNKLEIERISSNIRYRKDDYRNLDEFYRQKIQQIHIVGEFANMLVQDYTKAMEYVSDYFQMDFKGFVRKYFDSERQKEISLNVSPEKYRQIFGSLTGTQRQVIADKDSRYIVVAAGPGSGKTFLLVRKLASLILMEDVKSEQLLMLTFSRASASEFKRRLTELIGNAAKYVEIKTFHSYCFDILGQRGTLEKSENIVKDAAREIAENHVEISRITKSILVIDEAQDMSKDEFALIEALIKRNEDMRVIAVGDDDQNIYAFRGSDSRYMRSLTEDSRYAASKYEMSENFRSCACITGCADSYARTIRDRMKTSPIIPVRKDIGSVSFTMHHGCFEQAIVNEIADKGYTGSIAVLTLRNEDALILTALLNRHGRKARLIQSNDGFSLTDLAELHYFLESVRKDTSVTISDEVWNRAKESLEQVFSSSSALPVAMECIRSFETEYHTRYVSDIENYILESGIEDFSGNKESEIIVSTIHKAKGQEYDHVFISLKDLEACMKDETRRTIYVGLTRARDTLSVHSCIDFSRIISGRDISFSNDGTIYEEPEEVLVQLSHKDVVLNYFKDKSAFISRLRAGDGLRVDGDYVYRECGNRKHYAAKFSEAFKNRTAQLFQKGYVPCNASIRFVVYWRYTEGEGEEAKSFEIPVILPDITFRRARQASCGL